MAGVRSGSAGRWAAPALVVAVVAAGLWLWSADDEAAESGGAVVQAPATASDAAAPPAPAQDAAEPMALAPEEAAGTPAAAARSPDEVLAAALASAEHVLSGRIVRPDGTPVPGVALAVGVTAEELVETCSRAGWIEYRLPHGHVPWPLTTTDAGGRFRIPVPSRSRTLLLAVDLDPCDRHVFQIEDVEPGEHDAGDVVLDYAGAFSGQVVDADGQPVRDVQVLPRTDGRHRGEAMEWVNAMWSLRCVRSRADGTFLLKGLLDERGDVEFSTFQWESVTLSGLEMTPGLVADLGDIVLTRGDVIGGVVRGTDSQPVGRLRVYALLEDRLGLEPGSGSERRGTTRTSAVTDAEGRFLISGLREGVYSVHTGSRGLAMARIPGVPSGRADLVIDLSTGGRALIEVRSGVTGQPLLDATLDSRRPESAGDVPWPNGGLPVVSGDDAGMAPGTYVLENVDPVGAAVTVEAPGHLSREILVPGLAEGQVHALSVALERSLGFAGVARDHQDRLLGNVSVTLSPDDEENRMRPPAAGLSDAEGAFHLQGLAPGRWLVRAEREGYVGAGPEERLLADTDVDGFLVRLHPAGRLAGRVLAPSGGTAADSEVTALLLAQHAWPTLAGASRDDVIVSRPGPAGVTLSATADVEGRFVMSTLDPGHYLVTASREQADIVIPRLEALAPVQDPALGTRAVMGPLPGGVTLLSVPAGQVTEVELALPVPARILGRVSVEGHGAAGAQVVVLGSAGDRWTVVQSAEANPGGSYSVPELWPGEYAVAAGVVGEPLPRARVLSLEAGETERVDFGFSGVTQAVLLRDVATGEAVPGVALRIIRRTERLPTVECAFGLGWQEFWELTRRSAAFAEPVTSDAEGIARFPHLLPGDYNVSLESDEWSPTAGYQHTVGETWSPDIFVVEVRHLAVLEVTALDRGSGRVLTGLTVRLEPQPEPGDRSMSSHFRRLRDEVERFEHLEDGTYIVTLESEQGRALSSQPVTLAPGETRRLDFRIDA